MELKSTLISEAQHDKCPAFKKTNDPPTLIINFFFIELPKLKLKYLFFSIITLKKLIL